MYVNFLFNQVQYETKYHMYNMMAETAKTKKVPRVFIDSDDKTTRIYSQYDDFIDDANLGLKQFIITNRFDEYLNDRTHMRYVPSFILAHDSADVIAPETECRVDSSILFYPRFIYSYIDILPIVSTIFDHVTIDLAWQASYEKYYKIWTGKIVNPELPAINDNRIAVRYCDEFGNREPRRAYTNVWINPCETARKNSMFLHFIDTYMLENDINTTTYYWVSTDKFISNYMNDIAYLTNSIISKNNDDVNSLILTAENSFISHNNAAKILFVTFNDIDNDIFSSCKNINDAKIIIDEIL